MVLLNIPIALIKGIIVRYLNVSDVISLELSCKSMYVSKDSITKYIEWMILNKSVIKDGKLDMFPWMARCRGLNVFHSENIMSLYGCNRNVLMELVLHKSKAIGDDDICEFRNLEVLRLPRCRNITDGGIVNLVNLRVLDLSTAMSVSDNGIQNMINMEELRMFFNLRITMKGVMRMSNLRSIHMAYNRSFNEFELRKKFLNLKTVFIRQF